MALQVYAFLISDHTEPAGVLAIAFTLARRNDIS